MSVAMVMGGASLSGLGLAAYATGGEIGGLVQREAPATPLGANRSALEADRYDELQPASIAMSYASGPYVCEGCGPTLADRKAIAAASRYEAAIAADLSSYASSENTAPTYASEAPSGPIMIEDEPADADEANGSILLAAYADE